MNTVFNVGTKNESKLSAVRELLEEYKDTFGTISISGLNVESGTSEQPQGWKELVSGATNRAVRAYQGGDWPVDYGIGIESGSVPLWTPQGEILMNTCVVAITEKNNTGKIHYGFSSGFKYSEEITELLKQGHNLNDATKLAGLTEKQDIGRKEGIVGILTGGRTPRREYTKEALRMALIHLEKPWSK